MDNSPFDGIPCRPIKSTNSHDLVESIGHGGTVTNVTHTTHGGMRSRAAALMSVAFLAAACGGSAATTAPAAATPTGGSPTTPGATGTPAWSPTAAASPTFATTPGAVTLVAYSTPREAYAELIPLFQATDAGPASSSRSPTARSGDQSRAVAGRPAGRRRRLSLWAGHRSGWSTPGIVAAGLGRQRLQRHRPRQRRGVRRPPGQPQEHPDLGRPHPRGRDRSSRPTRSPRAAPSGTSWPPTAPDRGRQDRGGGDRVPRRAVRSASWSGTRAPATR